jgi:hypothetical protein
VISMDSIHPTTRIARLGLRALLVVLILAAPVFAQSCAMCYTTVAGGGQGVISALKSGIIVLLIPPLLLFTGLIVTIVRWKQAEPEAQPF